MRKLKSLFYLSAAALTVTAVIFAVSCKKSSTTAAETTTTATDQATAEKSFNDAQTISENAVSNGSGSLNYRTTGIESSGCATVTTTTSGGTTTTTINFGTTDCRCNDGRTRKGEIIVTYPTGSWDSVGATRTITFNNFYQNDNQVNGTKTVTYEGLNTSGQPYYNVTVSGSVIYASGKTVTASWNRVRTWLTGYTMMGTKPMWNWTSSVSFSISGTGNLTNSLGGSATVNIPAATPLVFAFGCQWIEAGTITYTLSDGKTRSINYGNTPNCDDNATVTLANGTTVNIVLP